MVIVVDILKEMASYLIIRLSLPCQQGPPSKPKTVHILSQKCPLHFWTGMASVGPEGVSSSERHRRAVLSVLLAKVLKETLRAEVSRQRRENATEPTV